MSSTDDTSTDHDEEQKSRSGLMIWFPVGAFFALVAMFAFMLLQPGRDASTLPSALIGQSAPAVVLEAIPLLDRPGIDPAEFEGVTVVNFFASWCAPCRDEHPFIMDIGADDRVTLVGVNHKDAPAQARQFLDSLGNPYAAIGADPNGRAGIEWGVYGMPETFIIAADGTVAFKHVGPITQTIHRETIIPEIERQLALQ
ncbi:MAG: DsbE family thiol:disulfide interchange protein [Pseudomonadota bacterium]